VIRGIASGKGGNVRSAKYATAGILAAALLCLAGSPLLAQEDIRQHRSCPHCGMDRKGYGYSRMLILYEDGGATGVCSLRCAAFELDANPERRVKAVLAADRATRELVDAEVAVWVMGGKKPGVMTKVAKWAFRSRADAEAFVASYGGTIVPWPEALAAAREELKATRSRPVRKGSP
jgi:nitrous oxide reductase accessory protein NosL